MTSVNPRGQVHWIGGYPAAEDGRQRGARQAIETHRALVAALPRHRSTLDANLTAELARLQRLRRHEGQLASRH